MDPQEQERATWLDTHSEKYTSKPKTNGGTDTEDKRQ